MSYGALKRQIERLQPEKSSGFWRMAALPVVKADSVNGCTHVVLHVDVCVYEL